MVTVCPAQASEGFAVPLVTVMVWGLDVSPAFSLLPRIAALVVAVL